MYCHVTVLLLCCYCVVAVLLLCCYCICTVMLLCCYCVVTVYLLSCYCVVTLVLLCCYCIFTGHHVTVLLLSCYFVVTLLLLSCYWLLCCYCVVTALLLYSYCHVTALLLDCYLYFSDLRILISPYFNLFYFPVIQPNIKHTNLIFTCNDFILFTFIFYFQFISRGFLLFKKSFSLPSRIYVNKSNQVDFASQSAFLFVCDIWYLRYNYLFISFQKPLRLSYWH
jgi:hypothetical protein